MEAFAHLKSLLSFETCMVKYHPRCPTVVSADNSSRGLGAVLLQDQPPWTLLAVAYASVSLPFMEGRYDKTEVYLAGTWAASRFNQYLRGLQLEIETDHFQFVAPLAGRNLELPFNPGTTHAD